MEYMQGGTLAEAVERYSFAESSVAYVAREVGYSINAVSCSD